MQRRSMRPWGQIGLLMACTATLVLVPPVGRAPRAGATPSPLFGRTAALATTPATRLGAPPPGMYLRLPTADRVVALTFDGGADLGHTVLILDTLKAKGVRATFGVTGDWAAAHPDMVRRMVDEGHQVMNHSMHHRSFTGVSSPSMILGAAARQADVEQADLVISACTGRGSAPFFRPPYGDTNASVQADLRAIGFPYVIMWTIDTLGWKGMSAAGIVNMVLTRVVPGAIVAGHVGSASQDGPALGAVIDGLRVRGYRFVTVAEGFGM